jgi:NADH-quinone oxidoreductase subunit L
MVTAGVFMVCRLSPMFEAAPVALGFVTFIGAATCLFAATVGTTQWDIKRVIAYSTCSQLGYMFFAAGVGAYGAAMFHLFTHAFFKALLFLGAGSVIHAMHHEQDMRFYGALRREIPVTFWVMVVGTLAITGVGIFGVGFAGYHSKDAILESAFASGSVPGGIAFFLGAAAALLTSFYSWRLIFLTFFGEARWGASEHIQHALHGEHEDPSEEHGDSSHDPQAVPVGTGGYHPHESPLTILVPIVLLAVGAAFSGLLFSGIFVASFFIQGNGALFVNGMALLIVTCGTLGAMFLSYPAEDLYAASRVARELYRKPPPSSDTVVQTMIQMAVQSRSRGVLALEAIGAHTTIGFLKRALGLLIDGLKDVNVSSR